MDKVLTVKEIADILKVCDRTAYRLINQASKTGEFKVIKLGSTYRVNTESFLNWLDKEE